MTEYAGFLIVGWLGLLAWIPTTRWLVGPLLALSEQSTRSTTYHAVDFMPLVLQLSLVGVLTSRVVNGQQSEPALVVLLVLILVEAFGSWWLSVRCLTLGGVNSLGRRFLFQLVVVPIGVLFPIFMVAIPTAMYVIATRWTFDETRHLHAVLFGLVVNLLVLATVYLTSRWVTAGATAQLLKGESDG